MQPGGWRGIVYHDPYGPRDLQQALSNQAAEYERQRQEREYQYRIKADEWRRGKHQEREEYSKGKVIKMSGVIWCNINDPETNVKGQVGHAFSDQDPEAQQYRQTRKVKTATGNSYGQTTYQDREEVTTVIDMCGYHVRKQMPFQADNEQAPAIESSIEDIEKNALEAERDMWRNKYDAERGRGNKAA